MISSIKNAMNSKRESPRSKQPNSDMFKIEKLKLTEHTEEAETVSKKLVEPELKVNTQAIGRFADEPEYRMNNPRRGAALIINNKHFENRLELGKRDGTDKDAAALEFSLSRLGFDIKLAHNCTAKSMRDLLFKMARADHSSVDCFVCVIMSHGDEGIVYGVDRPIEIDQLIQVNAFNFKYKVFFSTI